ncbi:hypothetical protein JB92DRAFT_2832638 [Gautieria morchelliformis]|nr:hypothetical protein JB92DRAFT_2832638 [Gautieria morchelliformis]
MPSSPSRCPFELQIHPSAPTLSQPIVSYIPSPTPSQDIQPSNNARVYEILHKAVAQCNADVRGSGPLPSFKIISKEDISVRITCNGSLRFQYGPKPNSSSLALHAGNASEHCGGNNSSTHPIPFEEHVQSNGEQNVISNKRLSPIPKIVVTPAEPYSKLPSPPPETRGRALQRGYSSMYLMPPSSSFVKSAVKPSGSRRYASRNQSRYFSSENPSSRYVTDKVTSSQHARTKKYPDQDSLQDFQAEEKTLDMAEGVLRAQYKKIKIWHRRNQWISNTHAMVVLPQVPYIEEKE